MIIVGSGSTIDKSLPAPKLEGQSMLFVALLPPGATQATLYEDSVQIATLSKMTVVPWFPTPGDHEYMMTFDVGEPSGIGFVTVVAQPPVLLFPLTGLDVIGSDIPLEASVYDDGVIDQLDFTVDAVVVESLMAPPWTSSYDSSGLSVGPHVFDCITHTAYGLTPSINPATVTFSESEDYPGENVPAATYIWWGGDGSTFTVNGTPAVLSWAATRGGQAMTAVALPAYESTGYAGKPCTAMNGTSQYYTCDGTVPAALDGAAPAFTVIMSFQFTDATPPGNTTLFSLGNSGDSDSRFIVRIFGTTNRLEVIGRGNTGGTITIQSVSGVLDDDVAPNVLAIVVTGTECHLYLNSIEVEMDTNAFVFPASVTFNRLTVFAQRLSGVASLFAEAKLRAIDVADTALSTANRNTIETTMFLDANP